MHSETFAGQTIAIVSATWPFDCEWVPPANGRNIHIGPACARAFVASSADVIVIAPNAADWLHSSRRTRLARKRARALRRGGLLQRRRARFHRCRNPQA
jgi:hypothetical protein